jgi:hypothetical protein
VIVDVYDGCLSRTKGCLAPLSPKLTRSCLKSKSCRMVVGFGKEDPRGNSSETMIEIYHQSTGRWAAIGFGLRDDSGMVRV